MPLTHEEIVAIKKECRDEFDERYVLQSNCNEKQENVNKKFADDDKKISIISHDFAVIKKLMWAVATSSIGALVVSFFELILK